MTTEQKRREIMYHASISPFKTLLKNGVLTVREYAGIDAILTEKYHPLFVEKQVDIVQKQR